MLCLYPPPTALARHVSSLSAVPDLEPKMRVFDCRTKWKKLLTVVHIYAWTLTPQIRGQNVYDLFSHVSALLEVNKHSFCVLYHLKILGRPVHNNLWWYPYWQTSCGKQFVVTTWQKFQRRSIAFRCASSSYPMNDDSKSLMYPEDVPGTPCIHLKIRQYPPRRNESQSGKRGAVVQNSCPNRDDI